MQSDFATRVPNSCHGKFKKKIFRREVENIALRVLTL